MKSRTRDLIAFSHLDPSKWLTNECIKDIVTELEVRSRIMSI